MRLYDPDPAQSAAALRWLEDDLTADRADGFISATELDRALESVERTTDLGAALQRCDWVQESAPERLEIKRALDAELDRAAPQDAILASSTSALDPAALFDGLPGARRCLVASLQPTACHSSARGAALARDRPGRHPGGGGVPQSLRQDPGADAQICRRIPGQSDPGRCGPRGLHLVETGVADTAAVDAVICDGLALRWATIGNFGANHTNAEGGIAQCFARYGEANRSLMYASTPGFFSRSRRRWRRARASVTRRSWPASATGWSRSC